MCGHRGREDGFGDRGLCVQGMETGGRLAIGETTVPLKGNKEVRLSRSQEPDRDDTQHTTKKRLCRVPQVLQLWKNFEQGRDPSKVGENFKEK